MKKRVLALFMAVSLASASFPMTAWATEIDVIPQQEESGVVEEPETTEELEKTEAPAEKSEVSEEQSATEQPETVEVTEQPETTEETEVVEEPEVTEETENVKEQEIEPLDVETEEAGEQGISIEEVLKTEQADWHLHRELHYPKQKQDSSKRLTRNRSRTFRHMVPQFIRQNGISIHQTIFITI